MDFQQLVQTRYSVRSYKPDAIPDEVLLQVLEAGRLAPTAANRQSFSILVIHTDGREDELKSIYGRDWFVQGPIVLGVCGIPAGNWQRREDGKNFVDVDASIVMDHLILAAADLGLGTCWIGAFDPEAARRVLNLPDGVEPIVFTPLGYPSDSSQPKPKVRRQMEEVVRYERW
ncbi:MAG: nitroreductase family protein [Anaerolineales bacterium]|nr:nitroreductase family protein [Anaerolineales bacterium]